MASLEPPGRLAEPADLQTAFGRSLAGVLHGGILPFVYLREVRRETEADVVVLDVAPELPQDIIADIRRLEPIAIRMPDSEDRTPEVFALRADFPADQVHLNVTDSDCPWPSLCLYDESWQDLRLHLTAARFVARIQDWLSRSARGDLHHPDQPLEPFVSPVAIPLILPPSVTADAPSGPLKIESRGNGGRTVLVATEGDGADNTEHLAFAYRTEPTKQAALRRHPSDLEKLDAMMLQRLRFDLVRSLRASLTALKDGFENFESTVGNARPVLVFTVPLTRDDGAEPERDQVFSYYVDTTVLDLGRSLGIWDVFSGTVGLVLRPDDSARGQGLTLVPLRPMADLTSEMARSIAGLPAGDLNVTAVGVGAVGSQVVVNLARSGFGRWTLIDDDSLLPHNLVRHALPRPAIGLPKADAVALYAGSMTCDGMEVHPVVANVLDRATEVDDALRRADVVLDMSATATVARALAQDREGVSRCMSLFLNPTGRDLVALVEDSDRRIRLDMLEMQHYRAVLRDPAMKDHLADPTGRIRYGTSCRDVTVRIPPEQVAVAAGIGARAVRRLSGSPEAAICLWRMDDDLAVDMVSPCVHPCDEWVCGSWTVIVDEWLLDNLAQMRRNRLPSETGGVLVGYHDMQRHRLYIADALAAPPDSTERPFFFDRGCLGLRDRVGAVEQVTSGALAYVGEWHSHPGRSTRPSTQDGEVLEFLCTHMAMDGLPGLMVIIADEAIAVFVDSMNGGVCTGGR